MIGDWLKRITGFGSSSNDLLKNSDFKGNMSDFIAQYAIKTKVNPFVVKVNTHLECLLMSKINKNAKILNHTTIDISMCKKFGCSSVSSSEFENTSEKKMIFVSNFENNSYKFPTVGFIPGEADYLIIKDITKEHLNLFEKHKVLGFFYKSIYNGTFNTLSRLTKLVDILTNGEKRKRRKNRFGNPEDNLKNNRISLKEITYMLSQIDTILGNPLFAKLAGNVKKEEIEKIKVLKLFIDALSKKEIKNPSILDDSRFKRITKKSVISFEDAKKYAQICIILLQKLGPMMQKATQDPSILQSMMSGGTGGLGSILSMLKGS